MSRRLVKGVIHLCGRIKGWSWQRVLCRTCHLMSFCLRLTHSIVAFARSCVSTVSKRNKESITAKWDHFYGHGESFIRAIISTAAQHGIPWLGDHPNLHSRSKSGHVLRTWRWVTFGWNAFSRRTFRLLMAAFGNILRIMKLSKRPSRFARLRDNWAATNSCHGFHST